MPTSWVLFSSDSTPSSFVLSFVNNSRRISGLLGVGVDIRVVVDSQLGTHHSVKGVYVTA